MKRLLCILLALLLLTGCDSVRLCKGYYLLPLEETEGVPFYFCLGSGGTGYVHAMGQEIPVEWSASGLEGDFSDGVPTRDGLEFPSLDGPLVLTRHEELPPEYRNDHPPEYYISQMED